MLKKIDFINNHRQLTTFDLKSELLFNALLDKEVDDLNIVIKSNGLFYRKFSKDKMNIAPDAVNPDIINIEISRDGFYDILPESFVHNYRDKEIKDDAVQEYKNRKREEKEARHFFNPLENELFRFRHGVEQYESDFFANLSSNGIVDIIKIILVVEDSIPDYLVVKMFYALLKHNQNTDQSVENIIKILEDMLDEKVTYTATNIKLEHAYDVVEKNNDLIMGINTTLESHQRIFLKKYLFSIGPLKNSENLQLFFQNQTMESFVRTFFNLFLPFHVQYSFDIHLNFEDEQFTMDDSIYKSRLGISTVL
jgi:hypothetical protein